MRDRFVDSTDTDSLSCKSRIQIVTPSRVSVGQYRPGLSISRILTNYPLKTDNIFAKPSRVSVRRLFDSKDTVSLTCK